MGTSYFDIYKRAITEFKDPTLKNLFDNQTAMFSQVMYNFLENAISMFTNPFGAVKRINDRILPNIYSNYFVGDGVKKEFILLNHPDIEKVDDCIITYMIDDSIVSGKYNKNTNTATLDIVPPIDKSVSIELYYVGSWNIDLYDMESYLLSQFIMAAWSEYVQNDKLDIIRLLGDTDFKLTAVSTTTTAKSNWNTVNRETVIKRMNKYAWDSQMKKVYQ